MKITLRHYTDDGHGWVAVKRHWLESFGIADKVTHYSYQKGNTVYLEHDCDAPLLIETMKKKGQDFDLLSINHNGNSPIRSYDRYSFFKS